MEYSPPLASVEQLLQMRGHLSLVDEEPIRRNAAFTTWGRLSRRPIDDQTEETEERPALLCGPLQVFENVTGTSWAVFSQPSYELLPLVAAQLRKEAFARAWLGK
jgi:hypothetical protein